MHSQTRILYDGQCPLCQRTMQSLAARDTHHRLHWLDLHQVDLQTLHPALEREACRREMHLLAPDGRLLRGFDAFRHIATQLPSMAWWAPLLYAPPIPQIGRLLYRWIARRRYGLGSRCTCRSGTCPLHASS